MNLQVVKNAPKVGRPPQRLSESKTSEFWDYIKGECDRLGISVSHLAKGTVILADVSERRLYRAMEAKRLTPKLANEIFDRLIVCDAKLRDRFQESTAQSKKRRKIRDILMEHPVPDPFYESHRYIAAIIFPCVAKELAWHLAAEITKLPSVSPRKRDAIARRIEKHLKPYELNGNSEVYYQLDAALAHTFGASYGQKFRSPEHLSMEREREGRAFQEFDRYEAHVKKLSGYGSALTLAEAFRLYGPSRIATRIATQKKTPGHRGIQRDERDSIHE
jgi:hypothetical protein